MVVANDSFTPTDTDYKHIRIIILAPSILGICVCFLVLVICGIVAYVTKGRNELDRVSFRLLIYTLICNIVYGIAYINNPIKPGIGCQIGAFVVNSALTLSTFFTTCIAINLQLVLVHGLNGKRMEKYYVIGTILLSLALNVLAAGLHHFGWDANTGTCWFASSKTQLSWIVGILSLPIALAATIESISSSIVLMWLYNYRKHINHLSRSVSYADQPGDTILCTVSDPRAHVRMDAKYRKIIIRIVMYPIVSLILNCTTVGLDLDTIMAGLHTKTDFRILIVDLCIYGVRTLSYGILAAADPAFIKAVRQLFLPRHVEPHVTALDFTPATLTTDTTYSHTTIHDTANLERKDAEKMGGMGRNLAGDTKRGSISPADRTENIRPQSQIEEIQSFTRQL